MADNCFGRNSPPKNQANLFSIEEAALFDMGTNDQNDWPDKRARVKNCFDELKKLLPQGQSLNTVEALETVVAQFKKLKEKQNTLEPVYNKGNVDCEKNSSQNTILSQLDEDEVLSMYNSVTFLDSIIRLLCSTRDVPLTDVSPELLKDWEQKNTTSSQYCSKTDFPRLPSYKSSDKSIQLLGEQQENPVCGGLSSSCNSPTNKVHSQWSDNVNFGRRGETEASLLTEENLMLHQNQERLKYLELIESDEHLSKFIPSLQRRMRKRHAACIEKGEEKEGQLITQNKDVVYHMATKFLKDNSGNAVHMPQQTNFYRQMFKITCLEGSKTNQAGGNAVGFNRTPFQQMCHPELLNLPNICNNTITSGYGTPPPREPQQTFRFGQHEQFHEVNSYTSPPPCMTVVSSLSTKPFTFNIEKPPKESSRSPTNSPTNVSMESKNSSWVSLEWTDSDRLTASKEPFWLENIDTSDDKFLKYEVKLKSDDEFFREFKKMEQSGELFEQLIECDDEDDEDVESGSDVGSIPTQLCLKKKPNLVDTDTDSNQQHYLRPPVRSGKFKLRKKSVLQNLRKPEPPVQCMENKKKSSHGSGPSSNASSKKSSSGYEASFEGSSSVTENVSSDDLGVFQQRRNHSCGFQGTSIHTAEQSNLVLEQLSELLHEMGHAPEGNLVGYHLPWSLQSDEELVVSESMSLPYCNTTSPNDNPLLFSTAKQSDIFQAFNEASSMFHQSSGIGTMSVIDSTGSSNKLEEAISGDVSSGFVSSAQKSKGSDNTSGDSDQLRGTGEDKSFSKVWHQQPERQFTDDGSNSHAVQDDRSTPNPLLKKDPHFNEQQFPALDVSSQDVTLDLLFSFLPPHDHV